MSTSTVARRAAPALAAVTVLLLVVGVLVALRSTGGGSADAAGSPGTAKGPSTLALTGEQVPPDGAPVEQRFPLPGALPAGRPDPVALQWLGAPSGAAGRDLADALGLPAAGRPAGGATTYQDGQRTL